MTVIEVLKKTMVVISPIPAYLAPVNYAMVSSFLGAVWALSLIAFLEVLLADKDARLQVYVRLGLWLLTGALFYVTGNFGLGYGFLQFYVVVAFMVEFGRAFRSVVE